MIYNETMNQVMEHGLRQAMQRAEDLQRENHELDRQNGLLLKYIEEKVGVTDPLNDDKHQEIKQEREQWQEPPPSPEPQD